MRAWWAVMVIALAACVAAPGDGAEVSVPPSPSPAAVVLPPTDGVLDYHLGGAYDVVQINGEDRRPDVVVRDSTAEPLQGAYNVCYVNGFQTQPDQADLWIAQPELMLGGGDSPVTDPDWPDEYVLDPGTPAQREGILAIVAPVIERCASAGFDAVEIDNVDTWTRFEGVSESGAHELARAYVEAAHGLGLAIAQKNAAEVAAVAHTELGFDFAVTEECAVWNECAAYTDVYGDHVLQVEYPEALADAGLSFADVCALADRAPLTVLRDRALVASGEPGYVFETC